MTASTTAQAAAAASAATIAAAASASDASSSTATATMQAAVQRRYAGPEEICVDTVPVPQPGDGEVLIEVHAAGVDRGVWHLATGRPLVIRAIGFGLRRPKQPVQGSDVAGVVTAVGAGVTRFAVGDEVFGTADGSFAQFAIAKADRLAVKPDAADFTGAGAMPVSAVTALQAVEDCAGVEAGQRVLVLGASGGVGSFAVQLAVAAGAHVTGVASAAKADLVRGLGAERVIDYRTTEVTALDESFDVIIDAGSLTSLRRLRRILSPTGTLVMVGGEGGDALVGGAGRTLWAPLVSLFTSQRLMGFVSATTTERLERVRDLVDDGAIRAAVSRAYPLDRAADAVTDLAAGRVAGKAVVIVRDAR
ncbi:NAD(P)-dependent alcohol dehydrogenase [Demequina sp. SYSU T00039]|uniref:NAD(P)-dependent alcohol dehydrogenase n=1 Tax=Demequina lignilytica TaxID=3051663 RepID=A0AAW7M1P8_9MICO|nr:MULTISPECIES: NAD(P)-dependent alcohol dehydrogenase [unclassified Demequina]MDN4478476.1 NAD(P)-dependent alcohol dehydrogenase [Demequina sp. SYSU T00039-1]MDN4487017.1 NAD(P)-dependent alcohol dehydrogenase [Demequina sp. SYSU T00039]